jgi:hypothetical protein
VNIKQDFTVFGVKCLHLGTRVLRSTFADRAANGDPSSLFCLPDVRAKYIGDPNAYRFDAAEWLRKMHDELVLDGIPCTEKVLFDTHHSKTEIPSRAH